MWFITVIETMDYGNIDGFGDTGDQRTWGFFENKEDAVDVLHRNATDMHEGYYDYAVIEEYEEGLCPWAENYQWFKYDESRDGYFEIDEPDCVKNICNFAIG